MTAEERGLYENKWIKWNKKGWVCQEKKQELRTNLDALRGNWTEG